MAHCEGFSTLKNPHLPDCSIGMFIIILAETIIVFGTNHPVLLLFDPSYQQN